MTFKLVKNADKQYLIVNCFKFREIRTCVNGDKTWRCCAKDCNSLVRTDSDIKMILKEKHEHKHKTHYSSPMVTARTPRAPTTPSTPLARQPVPATTPSIQPHTDAAALVTTSNNNSACNPSPARPLITEVLRENQALKDEIIALQAQLKTVLDHSIESDQRLLQFTSEVFAVNSDITTSSLERIKVAHDSQTCERDTSKADKNEQLTEDINSNLIDLQNSDKLLEPCKNCKILEKEAKEMIASIRCLEEELKSLRQLNQTNEFFPTCNMPGQEPIPLKNRYEALSEPDFHNCNNFNTVKNKKRKKFGGEKTNSLKKKKQKAKPIKNKPNQSYVDLNFKNITVIGDSHARGLASHLRDNISSKTKVTGWCKPGAGLLAVAPASSPPADHCYVLLAGTNDVAAGRQHIIFKHMETVLQKCSSGSKVLVSPLLPRHDLSSSSPIHLNVAMINNYIQELCDRHEGVRMVDISALNRRHFTAHGLHLRDIGKRLLSSQILKCLTEMPPPITRGSVAATGPSNKTAPTPTTEPATLPYESYAEAVKSNTQQPEPRHLATSEQHNSGQTIFLGIPLLGKGLN